MFGLVFEKQKALGLNCITSLDGCLSSMRPSLQDTVGAIKSCKIKAKYFLGLARSIVYPSGKLGTSSFSGA